MTQETLTQIKRKQVQNWLITLTNCRENLFLKDYVEHIDKAIKELEEALAKQEQGEPVAWALQEEDGQVYDCICNKEHDRHEGRYTVPLYTTPQPEERNFCSRCGKRTADLTVIHTCTPPQENT